MFLWAAGLALAVYLAGAVAYLLRWLSMYRPCFGSVPSAGRVTLAALLWPITLTRPDPFRSRVPHMTWPALFALLIKFLPVIAELLNELFPKARPAGDLSGLAPREGITRAFAAARAQTWVWQLAKRAKLRAAERIATRRADELFATLRFGVQAPVLTRDEREEILAA